ncbi:hypothetical protein ACL7TT_13140 [Microbulbifer sp. 2304DJ12-6]|uniref:hypothetical protein n=1 Tax=Microbulbifer sp. 2304DJ12-6 TaxID=3233340 RepID=UPI0039AF6359
MLSKIRHLKIFLGLIFLLSINVNAIFDEFAYTPVSVFELITVGEDYDDWNVEVVGVLYFHRESTMLFVSKEKYKFMDNSSAVFIDASSFDESMKNQFTDASGKYVSLQGLFNNTNRIKNTASSHTFGPAYSGVLSKIKSIMVLEN